jgi:putative transposase
VSKFAERLKYRQRDVRRVIEKNPDGPVGDTKLTVTRTGKYYLSVPIYIKKSVVEPKNRGHLVTLDPGANPFINYYSPTRFVAGSFGTSVDLKSRIHQHQKVYDRLSSRLFSDTADYLQHGKRKKLLRRRLLLQEKVRNLTKECINKVILFLVSNFQYIHGSIFPVADMVERTPGARVGRRTRRDLLTWHHGPFKTLLKEKAELIDGLVVGLHDEAYTTKTCGNCGNRRDPGGKLYHCLLCGYTVHRDINGARNQALKNCVGLYEWVSAVVTVGQLTLFI